MNDKDSAEAPLHQEEATGEPAGDLEDTSSYSPTGNKPTHHWKSSTVAEPGLDQRGTVFFAALQMTRMPMILTDPRQDDNPIVFANQAFLDLTGYEESEIVGRNCRFLQGPDTDRETVRALREAVAAHEAISTEILNYRRDGSPFWNAVVIAPVYDDDGSEIDDVLTVTVAISLLDDEAAAESGAQAEGPQLVAGAARAPEVVA